MSLTGFPKGSRSPLGGMWVFRASLGVLVVPYYGAVGALLWRSWLLLGAWGAPSGSWGRLGAVSGRSWAS